MNAKLCIAMVAAERVPLAKVGGLADVTGALGEQLAKRGHTVLSFLPAYRDVTLPVGTRRTTVVEEFPVPFGAGTQSASLERVDLPGSHCQIYLIDHLGDRGYFSRHGFYEDPATGEEFPDNAERFLFFCRAVCEAVKKLGQSVDVFHLNDNQTAFISALLRHHYADDESLSGVATVLSLHNLGYQGIHDPETLELARIPRQEFWLGSPFEFYGKVNFLKVGILFSNLLTTVSESYAREIQTLPEFGFGLEGVLGTRSGDLRGIANGIDYDIWNPQTDNHLPAQYSAQDLSGKEICRQWLAGEAAWPESGDWPLVGMIARLVDQKGLDLIEAAIPELLKLEARFFILGIGQRRYEQMFVKLAREHPDRFQVRIMFDDRLAHRIEAGCDLYLMPSRYEPCGLNQLISLRYGTIPVVRATGGLKDTVIDFDPSSRTGTGFVFQDYEVSALVAALKRALASYRQPHIWNRLVARAMEQEFTWDVAAAGYEAVYREAIVRSRQETRAHPVRRAG